MPKKIEYEVIDGIEHKKCTGECGELKPLSEFKTFMKDEKIYYHGRCMICHTNKEKIRHKNDQNNPRKNIHETRGGGNTVCKIVDNIKYKKCCDCDKLLIITEFHKQGNYYTGKCKDCMSKAKRKRYMTPEIGNIIKMKSKERERRPEIKAKKKIHNQLPHIKERINSKNRRLRKLKPDVYSEYDAKHAHKRRGLGYITLNKRFKGSHRHHLLINELGERDLDLVICIPKQNHDSINHKGTTGEGMIEINEYCLVWYTETYKIDNYYNEAVEQIIKKLQKIVEATKQEVKSGWLNRYEKLETTGY